jgi:drug/metabolite transporter (DMT)-like permease
VLNLKKYLVLLSVTCFGSAGDALLKYGMNDFGPIDPHQPLHVLAALANPWVLLGVVCLIGFFASYLSALSWADLSYVLPATALGYVVITLIGRYFLHENVSPMRWLGVLLISCGVGWVTRGPALTVPQNGETRVPAPGEQHEIA